MSNVTNLPDPPGKSVDDHEAAFTKSLHWLDTAVKDKAAPETFAEIARSIRGQAESLLKDAKLLEERMAVYWSKLHN